MTDKFKLEDFLRKSSKARKCPSSPLYNETIKNNLAKGRGNENSDDENQQLSLQDKLLKWI